MSGEKFYQTGKTRNQASNDKEIPKIATGSRAQFQKTDTKSLAKEEEVDTSPDWLAMARDAYETSDSYFESSIRDKIERNLSHFQSRHAKGSKYYSDSYKHRAKGFRPKTRSVVRRNEAKGAIALFATSDILTVSAEDDSIPEHRVSAEVNQELLHYRLTNDSSIQSCSSGNV